MTEPATIDTDALSAAIGQLAPTPNHASLVKAARAVTGLNLKLACIDDDWYRLGGVMDSKGRRLADDIEDWALAETGGDMTELYTRYGDAGLRFTRHAGRRVYLTVAMGPDPLDFLQIEVDQVQEMLCRPLFEGDAIPDTLVELESLPPAPDATPLTSPRYVYRRFTSFGALPGLTLEHKGDPRLRRFAEEWANSSAGKSGHFSERWALRVMPYRNSDGEHVLEAKPVTAIRPALPDLQQARSHAVDYHPARSVCTIDAEAGFPMAWYFLQVVRHYAHYRCMVDIRDDFTRSGASLPVSDLKILDRWIDDPYNFH